MFGFRIYSGDREDKTMLMGWPELSKGKRSLKNLDFSQ